MSLQDIVDDATESFEEALDELPLVPADKLGLDRRSGRVRVSVEDGCVVADKYNAKSLEYYGGFEYVADEYKTVFGDFVIYHAECDDGRVDRCLDRYEELKDETQNEGQ